ncbi:MAG: hypothetical protein WD625_11670 [Balneolales bacterium]
MMNNKSNLHKEFRFVGLSRSGNHAIINWTINQLDGRYCFLNCAEPKYNPFETARPLGEGAKTYITNIPLFNPVKEQQGEFSKKDYLLYSHEDCFLGSLNHSMFRENRECWVGPAEVWKDLLVLRDPFNLFASRIKSGLIQGHYTHYGVRPISTHTLKRIYKQHAREFLGEKRYLKNRVLINFNKWTADKEYRKAVAEKLRITFSDKGFKEVSEVAGGSSFDGIKLSGQANKMKLHNRWKEFASDESFWSLFDVELVELAREIFGDIPPVSYFYQNS